MNRLTVILVLLLAGCGTSNVQERSDDSDCSGPGCTEQEGSSKTSYRKVSRDPDADDSEPEVDLTGFTPFEPFVPNARLDDESRAKIDAFDGATDAFAVFRGDFATESGEEWAVVQADVVEVRASDGERLARRDVGSIAVDTLRAARLIDERLELILERTPADGEQRELVVLRVIGRAIAEVFVQPLEPGVEVAFVKRGEEKGIRVQPPEGKPALHLWNHWEGVFTEPYRAPTAPRSPSK